MLPTFLMGTAKSCSPHQWLALTVQHSTQGASVQPFLLLFPSFFKTYIPGQPQICFVREDVSASSMLGLLVCTAKPSLGRAQIEPEPRSCLANSLPSELQPQPPHIQDIFKEALRHDPCLSLGFLHHLFAFCPPRMPRLGGAAVRFCCHTEMCLVK